MNSLHSPQPAPDKSDPDRRIEFAPSGRIRTAYTATPGLDAKALAAEIAAAITGEVRFDNGSRALYATDSSNYRQVPIGVVIPETKEDVIRTIELCHRHNAPVLPRGGGTSLAGEPLLQFFAHVGRSGRLSRLPLRVGEIAGQPTSPKEQACQGNGKDDAAAGIGGHLWVPSRRSLPCEHPATRRAAQGTCGVGNKIGTRGKE